MSVDVSSFDEPSVISLLKSINESLTELKNQKICEADCHSPHIHCVVQRKKFLPSEAVCNSVKSSVTTNSHLGESSKIQSNGKFTPFVHSPERVKPETSDKFSFVPYGESTPLDESTISRFTLQYKDLLERPDVQQRLARLPPDDHRHLIPATRGNFLRQFMSDTVPLNTATDAEMAQLFLTELKRFEDFHIRLGTGHFWVRDYDDHGHFVQWDCVNDPSSPSVGDRRQARVCNIPASGWPVDWLNRRESRPVAPWRRIISCRGLSQTADSRGTIQNPYFSEVSQAVSMHLHNRYHSRKLTEYRANIHNKQGCLFQLTYAKNSTSHIAENPPTVWHGGSLYPGGIHHSTEFQSITIDALSDRPKGSTSKFAQKPDTYWTILLMDPNTPWFNDLDEIIETATAGESSMQTAMLYLVGYALQTAAREWQKMVVYFDTLVGNNLLNQAESTLLSPEKHDLLLFEDESFSRSRKYFWVVEALTAFSEKISDTLDVFEEYQSYEVQPYLELADHDDREKLIRGLDNARTEISKLKTVQFQLDKHLERTKLLRDGLFNASAVIESRAASELGRNVKLLTYVSIFYLPLSFCTSLWSTTNTFGFTNLIIVMVIISLATYVIVCNVEHLVKIGHDIYMSYRKRTVQRMFTDLRTNAWTDRARRFDRFEPDRRSTKPTDWYVLWAGILLLPRDVWRFLWFDLFSLPSRLTCCLRGGSKEGSEFDEDGDSIGGESGRAS